MVALIVILTIIVFIIVDFMLRTFMKRLSEAKIRKKRQEALDDGLRIDYSDEAKTLKRVHIENPKAKILAVDDEKVVLDSLRKILVFCGLSIDTVETGKEALGLIKKYDYDFVFTDLKMPEMDGVEVTKSVKHLRPDIDVIVITGYASIESAVETMKYGAMDYIQKPFTEDELIEFVNKSLIKRQDKIERQMRPKIRLVTSSIKESGSNHEINVPAGVFTAQNHLWVNIEMDGTVRLGIDDFVRKIIRNIDEIILPKLNHKVNAGELLFSIKHNSVTIHFNTPISGKINLVNIEHAEHPEWISAKPFELSWVCCLEPSNLSEELSSLKIGHIAVNWYKAEIEKYNEITTKVQKESLDIEHSNEKIIKEFCKIFFNQTKN